MNDIYTTEGNLVNTSANSSNKTEPPPQPIFKGNIIFSNNLSRSCLKIKAMRNCFIYAITSYA